MPPKKYKTDEERRAADALRKRLSRQNETEEQRRKRLEKNLAFQREKIKNETEEERKIRLAKDLAAHKRMRENETLEQREKRLARHRQDNLRRKPSGKNLELQRMKSKEARRKFYEARNQLLTVEPHQYEEKLKEMENISERLKARLLKSLDPQRIEEAKARKRFQELVKKTTMTDEEKEQRKMENYLRQQAKLASMSKEELQAFQERRREYQREFVKNLSGERLEKYKASVKKAVQKHCQKNRQKLRKKYENTLKTETPEQRQIRLQGYRITQAKKLLRKKLEKAGTSPKKIQQEIDQLVEKMKAEPLPPPETVSSYKPRPRKKNIPQGRAIKAEVPSEPYPSCGSERDYNWSSRMTPQMPVLPKCDFEKPHEKSEYGYFEEMKMAPSEDFSSSLNNLPDESEDIYSPAPESSDFPDFEIETEEVSKPSCTFPSDYLPLSPKLPQYSESLNEPEPSTSSKRHPSTHSWSCPKCKKVMSSSKNLTEHYKLVHCPQKQGKVKGKNATTKGPGRKTESKLKAKRATFFCMKCPKITSRNTFQDKNKLLVHVKQKHSKFYFPCPNCNLLKYNSAKLELHTKICSKISESSSPPLKRPKLEDDEEADMEGDETFIKHEIDLDEDTIKPEVEISP